MSGYGTYNHENGDVFQGEMKENLMIEGILYKQNGKAYKVRYEIKRDRYGVKRPNYE